MRRIQQSNLIDTFSCACTGLAYVLGHRLKSAAHKYQTVAAYLSDYSCLSCLVKPSTGFPSPLTFTYSDTFCTSFSCNNKLEASTKQVATFFFLAKTIEFRGKNSCICLFMFLQQRLGISGKQVARVFLSFLFCKKT